jgi:L-asparaginase
LQQGVAVVICSRCTDGRVIPSYGTKAGAAALVSQGCILASMSGPKARILLMLSLGISIDHGFIQSLFDPKANEFNGRKTQV